MAAQPKPKQQGADAHRNESTEDEDTPVTPAPGVGGGGGGDGGGGGGGRPPASGSSGESLIGSIDAKKVALGAAVLLGAFLAWRLMQNDGFDLDVDVDRDHEGDGGGDGGVPEDGRPQDPDQINIPQDPNDPLKADEAVGSIVFPQWGEYD